MDLDTVTSDLISIKIRSGEQSCTSPNRIFIEATIYDDFVKIVLDKFSNLKVGDGFAPDSNIGPLINKAAVDKIVKLLEDAIKAKEQKFYVAVNHMITSLKQQLLVIAKIIWKSLQPKYLVQF